MYIKIENNAIIEPEFEVHKDGAIITNYNSDNNKDMLIADGFNIEYTDEMRQKYDAGELTIKDNQFINASDIEEDELVTINKRIFEIDTEIMSAQSNYENMLNTPIEYPENGFMYKPSYAKDDYESLISNFDTLTAAAGTTTLPIEDSTHLPSNVVNMTKSELSALALFLAQKQVEFRETFATTRSTLSVERRTLTDRLAEITVEMGLST